MYTYIYICLYIYVCVHVYYMYMYVYTGWRTKCQITDCTNNTFLLLQKHWTSGTELILTGWKIVPN